MTDIDFFEISGNGNFIRIELLGLNYPNADMQSDANWISGNVSVQAGAFSGNFKMEFETTDFPSFKIQLEKLYEKLNGFAVFYTIENQVEIKISGDGNGHLNAACEVVDFPGYGNKLNFEIDFDQTHLPKIIAQLLQIMNKYPVRA
jgi:hypothetical protein